MTLTLEIGTPTFRTALCLGHGDALSCQIPLHTGWRLGRLIFPEDFNPHCDLDLEDSNQKLPQNTLAHSWWRTTPIPWHVWLQQFRRYGEKNILFRTSFNPSRGLPLKIGNPNIWHDTPGYDDTPTYQVHYKRLSGSDDVVRTNMPRGFEPSLWPWGQQSKLVTQYSGSWWCTTMPSLVAKGSELQVFFFRISTHTVTLTLKIGTKMFRKTLPVMMIHQYTNFHKWRLSGQKIIIIRTNMPWGFEPSLWPWSWGKQSRIITQHSRWCTTISNWLQKFRRYGGKLFFWWFEPALWPWLWRWKPNLFAWHSRSWRCTIISSLVACSLVVQNTSSRQRCDTIPIYIPLLTSLRRGGIIIVYLW